VFFKTTNTERDVVTKHMHTSSFLCSATFN